MRQAAALNALRSEPPFLHQVTDVHALCQFHPPYGLRDRDPARVISLLNASRASFHSSAAVAAGNDPCHELVVRLREATSARHVGATRVEPHPNMSSTWRRCAVVGSGGGLIGSNHAAAIDQADAVMRFNFAPTRGFAADVGHRTTVRIAIHHPWLTLTRAPAPLPYAQSLLAGGARPILYCHNPWLGRCHANLLESREGDRRERRADAVLVVNPRFISRVAALLGSSAAPKKIPSSGFVGIGLALRLCEQVQLFGFGNASAATTSTQGHCVRYWDCRASERDFFAKAAYHDWPRMWRALERLQAAAAVELVPAAAAAAAQWADQTKRQCLIQHCVPW